MEAAHVDAVHIDVMDGHFVPYFALGADVVQAVRKIPKHMQGKRWRNARQLVNLGGIGDEQAGRSAWGDDVERAREVRRLAPSLKVAVVTGDDVFGRLDEFLAAGHAMKNMDTGEPLSTIRDRILSANAYIGAFPLAEAFKDCAGFRPASREALRRFMNRR